MELRRRIIKGGTELLAGQAGEQLLSFLRNMLVARLLSPYDFGIAATFTLIMTTLQMVSDLAFGRFLVQSSDGEDPVVQNTTHSAMVAKGMTTGLVLFLAAPLLGNLFGIPQATWAYAWLALAPIIRGFAHSDASRFQRSFRFRTHVGISLFSQFTAFATAAILAYWVRSYEAILWSTIIQAVAWTASSHLLAERPYRLGWSQKVTRRIWAFGWPLMANGVVLFASNLGDRFLVGASFAMSDLAIYMLAGSVVFVPSLLAAKISNTLFLPVLSQVKNDQSTFRRRHNILGVLISILNITLIVPLIALGSTLLPLIFGPFYHPPDFLMAFLAVASGMRICKSWTTTTAISVGRTRSLMYANILRLTGIGAGMVSISLGYGPVAVAASMAGAEFMTTIYAALKVNADAGLPRRSGFGLLVIVFIAFIAALASLYVWRGDVIRMSLTTFGLVLTACFAVILSSPSARCQMRDLLASTRIW